MALRSGAESPFGQALPVRGDLKVAATTSPDGKLIHCPLAPSLAIRAAWGNAGSTVLCAPRDSQRGGRRLQLLRNNTTRERSPAFERREICQTYTAPAATHLFELGSHTHRHGQRFRIYRGQFTCAGGPNAGRACSPLSPELCAGAACLDPSGRTAAHDLLYTSFTYNDPVVLRFDPPLVLDGAASDRTLTYCSLYDNGASDPTAVKRQSTSPRGLVPIGGPCATPSHCMAGRSFEPCAGANKVERDQSCDSSPGAGDGLCDACTLLGGLTTEDEMFVLLGRYFIP